MNEQEFAHVARLLADETYAGIGTLEATEEEIEKLRAPVDEDNEGDVRPDGKVFVAHTHVRRRIINAFGLQWGLRPLCEPMQVALPSDGNRGGGFRLTIAFALYIRGVFVSMAWGDMDQQDNQAYGDVTEGCKSNALTKCAKDLGIASECWDKGWAERFLTGHCVKVWVDGRRSPQWRRLDRLPFYNEKGMSDDSPNRDKYNAPPEPKPQQARPAPQQQQRPAAAPAQRPAAAPAQRPAAAPAQRPQQAPAAARPASPQQQRSAPPAQRQQQQPPPPEREPGDELDDFAADDAAAGDFTFVPDGATTLKDPKFFDKGAFILYKCADAEGTEYTWFDTDKNDPGFDGRKLYELVTKAAQTGRPVFLDRYGKTVKGQQAWGLKALQAAR